MICTCYERNNRGPCGFYSQSVQCSVYECNCDTVTLFIAVSVCLCFCVFLTVCACIRVCACLCVCRCMRVCACACAICNENDWPAPTCVTFWLKIITPTHCWHYWQWWKLSASLGTSLVQGIILLATLSPVQLSTPFSSLSRNPTIQILIIKYLVSFIVFYRAAHKVFPLQIQ